jgi:hypothetical protein
MKRNLSISFFLWLGAIFLNSAPVYAQAAKETPATHMWIRTSVNSVIYIPVRSLEQCILLTQQAAAINSSESNCYNGDRFLKTTNCQKGLKNNAVATCS